MTQKKMGRPRKMRVTPEMIRQVETMAGLGMKMPEIGLVLNLGARTLRRYKEQEPLLQAAYERGRAAGAMIVQKSLRLLIADGNVAATIFYLKTQCGWREKDRIEVSGPDGGPIPVENRTADVARAIVRNRLTEVPTAPTNGNGNGNGSQN